ncbi:MAG: hypothetical protein SZ59_C0001G0082 [candidate division TM6 bacterium GW2011_GWF2_28_16]|nr:MAG: hypothetical protein SZ59_C0001G0082 [candidate division TM6 bacterium GW2011_GWF2_28_16]
MFLNFVFFKKNLYLTLFLGAFSMINGMPSKNERFYSKVIIPFFNAVKKDDIDKVMSFVDKDPTLINFLFEIENHIYNGETPLIIAAQDGLFDMAEFLIGKGANVDYAGKDGTPLICAARMRTNNTYNERVKIIKLLIDNNANPNIQDKSKDTALTHAAGQKEIVEELLENNDIDLNIKNKYGDTALNIAASYGSETVVLLVNKDNGASINIANREGKTPIYQAVDDLCHWIHIKDARHSGKRVVKFLLENGADFNIKDNEGHTPLDWIVLSINITAKFNNLKKEVEYLKKIHQWFISAIKKSILNN